MYETFWDFQINAPSSKQKNKGGNKLRTYNKLKQNFSLEPYLTAINDTWHRSAYTQIRISSHRLNIEALRGKVKDPTDRLCNMCNLKVMEDEIHFMATCPKYKTPRDNLLLAVKNVPNIQQLNDENKTIWLLTNEDKNICKRVGKYINECLKIRRENT